MYTYRQNAQACYHFGVLMNRTMMIKLALAFTAADAIASAQQVLAWTNTNTSITIFSAQWTSVFDFTAEGVLKSATVKSDMPI
jgi:hypothetical protein